jgi:hypothetical protein
MSWYRPPIYFRLFSYFWYISLGKYMGILTNRFSDTSGSTDVASPPVSHVGLYQMPCWNRVEWHQSDFWNLVLQQGLQGTVLGPLLFLVYINDLLSNVNATGRLFADDCLLYHTIKTTDDAVSLQNNLDTLQQWEKDWLMSLFHDSVLSMVTPRYFALFVSCNTWPWMVYLASMIFFLFVILMTSHLSGLESRRCRYRSIIFACFYLYINVVIFIDYSDIDKMMDINNEKC